MTLPTETNNHAAAPATDTPKGHPRGLYVLFFTEMWERFSYYGMRALLVLYMIKGLQYSQPESSRIYGWYTGLVYLTPIFGGMLADRVLGYRRTILLGGTLMMIGHFLMAVESRPFFYLAMGFLILGNGAFKPNISTIVGKLYAPGDARRDGGFSIFYMGINLGAFFSPIVCGYLGEKIAWKYGFGAAGVGMGIGLITFMLGQKRLSAVNIEKPDPQHHAETAAASEAEKRTEMGRIAAIFIMALFTVFFWMAFEQAGNTMTLWADDNTHRFIGSWEVPASLFQSINAGFIFLLAPIFSLLWIKLARVKLEPRTTVKFVLGLVFLGLGFVVMAGAAQSAGSETGKVSLWWLVAAYLLHTVGELCLSPIGLSMVTKLSPARLTGTMMGVWFIAVFAGNKLAGMLGELYAQYSHKEFFSIFVISSIAAAGVLALLVKPLKKLMAGAA